MNPEEAIDPSLRPRNPQTGDALEPRMQPGYYAGFSTLQQQAFWDDATRNVVTARVDHPPDIRYFSAEEARFWTAVFDHLIPQTDRTPDRQIPIVVAIDHHLYTNQTIGYRFEDMPSDREIYRLGQQAIEQEAQHRYAASFLALPHLQQDLVLKTLHDGDPKAAKEIWKRMSVHRFWMVLMQDAIDAYYAHPWAWDEIGFGGPAYPRGYMRLERGEAEPWEIEEQRYDWLAPANAVSDEIESTHEFDTEALQHQSHSKAR